MHTDLVVHSNFVPVAALEVTIPFVRAKRWIGIKLPMQILRAWSPGGLQAHFEGVIGGRLYLFSFIISEEKLRQAKGLVDVIEHYMRKAWVNYLREIDVCYAISWLDRRDEPCPK